MARDSSRFASVCHAVGLSSPVFGSCVAATSSSRTRAPRWREYVGSTARRASVGEVASARAVSPPRHKVASSKLLSAAVPTSRRGANRRTTRQIMPNTSSAVDCRERDDRRRHRGQREQVEPRDCLRRRETRGGAGDGDDVSRDVVPLAVGQAPATALEPPPDVTAEDRAEDYSVRDGQRERPRRGTRRLPSPGARSSTSRRRKRAMLRLTSSKPTPIASRSAARCATFPSPAEVHHARPEDADRHAVDDAQRRNDADRLLPHRPGTDESRSLGLVGRDAGRCGVAPRSTAVPEHELPDGRSDGFGRVSGSSRPGQRPRMIVPEGDTVVAVSDRGTDPDAPF